MCFYSLCLPNCLCDDAVNASTLHSDYCCFQTYAVLICTCRLLPRRSLYKPSLFMISCISLARYNRYPLLNHTRPAVFLLHCVGTIGSWPTDGSWPNNIYCQQSTQRQWKQTSLIACLTQQSEPSLCANSVKSRTSRPQFSGFHFRQ